MPAVGKLVASFFPYKLITVSRGSCYAYQVNFHMYQVYDVTFDLLDDVEKTPPG